MQSKQLTDNGAPTTNSLLLHNAAVYLHRVSLTQVCNMVKMF